MARRDPSPITTRSPSRTCRNTPSRGAMCKGASVRWIRRIERAETAKKNALASTAIGAVSNETRPPPRAGPQIWAPDRVLSSMLLPWASCSRRTSRGNDAWYATSKVTVKAPTTKAMTYSSGRPSRPKSQAIGMHVSARARPKSAKTITPRDRRRSTRTPTSNENNRIGTCCTARSAPSCAAPAPRDVTASSGSVTRLACVPA